jgi:N12 class adenine-specific DNA methylase
MCSIARGRPDIDEIAAVANISRSEVLEELASAIFKVPDAGETFQTREQYLSGNVRAKLDLARAAAERDPDFRRNVTALEAVQPTPLGPADIAVNLGMPWVPPDVVEAFATSLGLQQAKATYRRKLAQWSIAGNRYSAAASSQWGTPRRDAFELLNAALNRQDPKVFDTVRDAEGREVQVLNPVDDPGGAGQGARAARQVQRMGMGRPGARGSALYALQHRVQQPRRAGL